METSIENEGGIDPSNSSKRSILWKLDTTIDLVTSSSADFVDNHIPGGLTQALCTVIEAVFIHGLRDAFFLKGSRHSNRPSPNFWPFVSKYTQRSIKTQISTLNQIHTEIGRARAWIRIVLNEYSLDHYISMFVKDTRQMKQFYADDAFLRDSECVNSLGVHLKRINGLKIAAPTNSSLLNTWTPSPLSLAGLIKTAPSIGAFAFQSAAVPLPVPFSSPSFNGVLPTGKGFKIGSSSPSASSSVLLADDEVAIASGEQQMVAEFGMNADQLLLDEGEQCGEDERASQTVSADDQRQQVNSSASMAMADDLESVYSHPSMLEEHQHPPLLANAGLFGGTFDQPHHYQRRQNMHNSLFSTTYQHANNKWMMAAMPAEELSTEVIVHRKAAQRHRRRTVSKSSGGDSDNGSSSRCHSNANLHAFEESSLEGKEGNLSVASNANVEETMVRKMVAGGMEQAPVFEEETPALSALRDSLGLEKPTAKSVAIDIKPKHRLSLFLASFGSPPPSLGTSLQDELLLAAAAVAGKDDDDKITVEELARKKFSQQGMALNSKIVQSSGKVTFSYSTDSVDELHEPSNNDGLPATFDEALRDFLDREAQKRRTNRARTSSSTTNVRLFSECSSSSAGTAPQQQSPSNMAAMPGQSPSSLAGGVSARGAGGTSSKRGSAAPMTAFLFRSKELPSMPFKREKREDFERQIGSDDELITIPVPPPVVDGVHHLCTHWTTPSVHTFTYAGGTSPSSATPSEEDGIYRLPRRLLRLTQIPRELGLDAQEFRCAGCRRNIGASFGPFNVCALNGRCYCVGHCINATNASGENGATTIIPARVLLNGDFRPRMISRESLMLLRSVGEKPFMHLDMLNPQIYAHCQLLRKVRNLRHVFSLHVLYLFSCKDSVAEDAKRRIWPQKHWHEDIHLYSIADFESVANGTMERRLNALIIFAQCHIQGCQICLQKGFFCELCNASDQPIYPFQTDITLRCPNCASVFHKECAKKAGLDDCICGLSSEQQQQQNKCPKCIRRAKYASTTTGNNSNNALAQLENNTNTK
ncbi:hypothetical protein niasHS_001538 [Heterodera schachtii]|uniref:RUN domain-containing protein n=1 Tax=Heterodera schachtii TaxID=97005 RepID=A0ABD2KEF3_HETSC